MTVRCDYVYISPVKKLQCLTSCPPAVEEGGIGLKDYAVLVHLFARCSGLEAGELVHVIADAHVYDRHVPIVKELIERPSYPAPKLVIDEGITDFYAFTADNIRLEGYQYGEKITGIPVAE